jgi:hypothetical protein
MDNLLGAIFALVSSFATPNFMVTQPAPDPIVLELREFLAEKKSPMPAEVLVKYPNWQMIVAVSAAESGYGRNMAGDFNAWGLKDFRSGSKHYRGYRDFASWEESIAYTSELLFKYDEEDGSPEPKAMVAKWKYLRPFGGWLGNVHYSLNDIQKNVIAAANSTAS